MRHTEKTQDGRYAIVQHPTNAINKLGALEDIEEEIGIDLVTLIKAVINGCWVNTSSHYSIAILGSKPHFIEPDHLCICHDCYSEWETEDAYEDCEPASYVEDNALILCEMEYEEHIFVARLKDYGKTWALTKEELEEDK